MKPLLALLLCASLAANVLLFKNRSAGTTATNGTQVEAGEKSAPQPVLTAETWSLITSGDPSGPEKLRALGIPEKVIHALIREQVNNRYRDREKALYPPASDDSFWRNDYGYARWRALDQTAIVDLRREKEAELKSLLGADYRQNDVNNDPRTNFLPADKAEQLRLVAEDYNALRQNIRGIDSMITLPEDREKLAYLEKQERADLAEILTPDELAAYDLRASNTASQLRYQLATINLTEEEFKTIYAIRKPYDDQHQQPNGMMLFTPPSAGSNQARDELESQLKAALGDERFADYKRAQDYDYRTITSLTSRLGLPPEKAAEAHTLKVALEEKLRAFRPTPGTSPMQQRTEFLATLSREAETGFTHILGEKGYAAYKDYGQIFRRLQPPTPPAARP